MNQNETSILIIEDENEMQIVLKKIISKHFNIIYVASDGKAAEKIVRENKPDLILTDIEMPEQSGIDFVIKMRSEGLDIPTIIVSGSRHREHLLKALKLGIQNFVEKPFKKEDIEMAVYRALEISVREKGLLDLINKFGENSPEVKQQHKLIGLLQALSSQA